PYDGTAVRYYPLGEDFLQALLADLQQATQYIFMEYFIIDRGKCWNAVLDVLQQKAAQGVDVRILYDDFGCLLTLPGNYPKKLKDMGIKVHVFNKIKPTFNIRMNNRTHRKITVIDGRIAYTGGVNLADEYVNAIDKFGHWKDTAVRLSGNAAQSFAVMFLQFWMLLEKEYLPASNFLPALTDESTPQNGGYVQPIASYPDQNLQVIEKALMEMVHTADRYVYINTPYLIPDNEFVTALCLAAQSGVDVRITMPHIPDKRIVFTMSRSFYPVLLKAGVKIYEYLPGFVHAKSMLCDDSVAYVGTCNLDYRSFYLHYECGTILYDVPALADMKTDYLSTLEKCKQITYEEATDVRAVTKLARSVLRLFAPLM
ncbi:MAG: cardiolipin synthase, partial [Clostridiales bacterium]|nr:cardiolipin synthase [Clostridiales bacterium]